MANEEKTTDLTKIRTNGVSFNENVISWAHLVDQLEDEKLINKIMQVFREDVKQQMEMLATAVKTSDTKQIELFAHTLKGTAANVGVKLLSKAAFNLECAIRTEDTVKTISLFDDVKKEFEKVVSFLSKANWIEIAKQQSGNKQSQVSISNGGGL